MIDFRDITLEDRDRAASMICASGCHGADYSFANMYIWRKAYRPQVYFTDNRMLVAMPQYHVYAYPKGGGDVTESLELLLDHAHGTGRKLFLRGLTDKTLKEFLPLYGDRFEITEDRDNADYIYTAEKLCKLPGRHLSSKRNHIKHFERNGPWHFDRITCENCDVAKAFVDEFYREKGDPSLAAEAEAIDQMFEHYRAIGFLGGLLYQNDVPVAFTAGTQLDDTVFDVHFEKALPGLDGAYTMVNREFANLVCETIPEIQHFNREEDMGIEGLRRAKESYHPDVLLMKYFAKEK